MLESKTPDSMPGILPGVIQMGLNMGMGWDIHVLHVNFRNYSMSPCYVNQYGDLLLK